MRPYLDLLSDERLRVRSLEASVFFDHPAPTLDAIAVLDKGRVTSSYFSF